MVHEDTLRDIVDGGATIVGSLVKDMLIRRQERGAMEARMDKEIELAETRARLNRQEARRGQSEAESPPVHPDHDLTAAEVIDELIERETCSTCISLLEGLKERPPREQLLGLEEYGEFKGKLSDGADVEELKELLRETEVLQDIFHEDIRGRPL